MNKIVLSLIVIGALCSCNAIAQTAATDPAAPYHDYMKAMVSTDEEPLTAVWQLKERKAIDAATKEDVLASFVADEDSARVLLLKVGKAYTTDPVILTQIAAVTQWVMMSDKWYHFLWNGPRASGRKIWTNALIDVAEKSTDAYVKIFCLQQLRLCACRCQVSDIIDIGLKANDGNVREVAESVARGIMARK